MFDVLKSLATGLTALVGIILIAKFFAWTFPYSFYAVLIILGVGILFLAGEAIRGKAND